MKMVMVMDLRFGPRTPRVPPLGVRTSNRRSGRSRIMSSPIWGRSHRGVERDQWTKGAEDGGRLCYCGPWPERADHSMHCMESSRDPSVRLFFFCNIQRMHLTGCRFRSSQRPYITAVRVNFILYSPGKSLDLDSGIHRSIFEL